MNGYVLNLRLRRAGAAAATDRSYSLTDKDLARAGRYTLFVAGLFLLLAGPYAMAALSRPEGDSRCIPWPQPGFVPTMILE